MPRPIRDRRNSLKRIGEGNLDDKREMSKSLHPAIMRSRRREDQSQQGAQAAIIPLRREDNIKNNVANVT